MATVLIKGEKNSMNNSHPLLSQDMAKIYLCTYLYISLCISFNINNFASVFWLKLRKKRNNTMLETVQLGSSILSDFTTNNFVCFLRKLT